MTAVIPNCLKYDPTDATKCLTCDHYLQFGQVTGKCECVTGSGTTCDSGFNCSGESHTCIPMNQCLDITNCQECKYADHSVCHKCSTGFSPTPDGKSCVSLSTCKSIKKCKACSLTNPDQCQTCQSYLTPSADGKVCECVKDSGEYCPSGQICTLATRVCAVKDICKKDIPNCRSCEFTDNSKCYSCHDGYSLENGLCVQVNECMAASPNCAACDPKTPANCLKCKSGLTLASDLVTCECTLGSKQACHDDQICSKYYHICVEKMACLSFPSIVQGCSACNYYDSRFCYSCQKGLMLSPDRLSCVDAKACQSIYGCNDCNTIQPNLCFKCEQSLTLSSTGLACFCGKDGQVCQNGTSCVDGSCQSMVQNKTSSGQLAGIIAAIVILIAIIAGLLVFIFVSKRKSIKSAPQDMYASASHSKSAF